MIGVANVNLLSKLSPQILDLSRTVLTSSTQHNALSGDTGYVRVQFFDTTGAPMRSTLQPTATTTIGNATPFVISGLGEWATTLTSNQSGTQTVEVFYDGTSLGSRVVIWTASGTYQLVSLGGGVYDTAQYKGFAGRVIIRGRSRSSNNTIINSINIVDNGSTTASLNANSSWDTAYNQTSNIPGSWFSNIQEFSIQLDGNFNIIQPSTRVFWHWDYESMPIRGGNSSWTGYCFIRSDNSYTIGDTINISGSYIDQVWIRF